MDASSHEETSSNDSFPVRPTGPKGFLFDGPEYRYTLVSPLLDVQDPLAVVHRTPLCAPPQASCSRAPRPQRVLLKRVVTPPRLKRRQRAVEEVQLLTHLVHPTIAPVYGLEEHQGELYVVMAHQPGFFLETFLETASLLGRTLSPAACVAITAHVADALHAAWHSTGQDGTRLRIVHRAVSPRSIRVEFTGRVWLTDFGVACSRLDGRLETSPRVLRANLAYAAPELMRGEKPDGRADLYSLGLVLLEMLSGHYPLDPPDVALPVGTSPQAARHNAHLRAERSAWTSVGELAERILGFGPEDIERAAQGVPEPLKRVVHKALQVHPDDRYQTGEQMREELLTWLQGEHPRFRNAHVGAELKALVRDRPMPEETGAFPAEKGLLLTPEEEASAQKRRTKP
jgi:eukaryotic-like serine/threonine-protein kinase